VSIRSWVEVGVAVVVVGLIWSTVSSLNARSDAIASASEAAGKAQEARIRADELSEIARALRVRAEEAIEEAAQARDEADQASDSLETLGDLISAESHATGDSLLDAIKDSTAAAIAERHLEADRRRDENFRLQLAEMASAREAEVSLTAAWRGRALAAEAALAARELECNRCEAEAEQWRDIAQPSFFRSLLGSAKTIVVTAGVTILTTLVVLR